MIVIVEGLGQFLPGCFILCVVAVIWDAVMGAFTGGRL